MAQSTFEPFIRSRRNNFDVIRFFLAAIVLLGHCVPEGEGYKIGRHVFYIGSHAVDAFFAISGFLITSSWQYSKSAGRFVLNRIRRIYPGLAGAILFCVVIVGPLGGATVHGYLHHWPSVLRFFSPLLLGVPTGLPGVFQHGLWPGSVDGPLWTIHYEILCYVLVLVLGSAGLLKRREIVLFLFVTAVGLFALTFYHPRLMIVPYFGDIYQVPRLTAFFLAGATFYLYSNVIPRSRIFAVISLVILAVFFSKQPFIPTTFGIYILFYAAFSQRLNVHSFAKHGDYSYGMYVYGFPVMQLITAHFGNLKPAVLFLCTFVITLPIAALSWHFVEKPFLKAKSNRPAIAGEQPLPPAENSTANADIASMAHASL